MSTRRSFLAAFAAGAGAGVVAHALQAQQPQRGGAAGMAMDTTNLFAMNQDAARVRSCFRPSREQRRR